MTNRNGGAHPLPAKKATISARLGRLATSSWALSCSSFLVTALLIRSDFLTFF